MNRALLLFIAFLSAAPLSAQERQQETPKPTAAPTPKPTAVPKPDMNFPVNIKVDLTITEAGAGTAPTTKTLSLLTAENSFGRIRTSTTSVSTGQLNVDARPRIHVKTKILLELTVEYRPGMSPDAKNPAPELSESLRVLLDDGKPLVVSQSADPNSDRKVTLEVKATVLR
jgi:hypothetical protein